MATTSHLNITYIEPSQAQKEVTANEAFARIDAVLNTAVKDKDLATPPGSPAEGDVYIVASSPTGDWSGKAGQLAYFDQIWRFIVPKQGACFYVADEAVHYLYNGTAWERMVSGIASGLATLSSGSVTVANSAVTSSSPIILTSNIPGGTPGDVRVSARIATTSFTITSSSSSDSSQIAWMILR